MSGPTDDGTPRPADEPAQRSGMNRADDGLGTMMAGLSRAEQLMGAGALLALIGGEWLFGALLGGGALAPWVLVATAELLLAIWIRNRRPAVTWILSYGLVVSALVVSVVTTEFSDLLFTLVRGGLTDSGAATLLAALSAWIGAALMAWGAAEYWRSGGG